MNTFLARRSLKYWMFSGHRRGHGIHSPFIFNLFSEFFANKSADQVVKTVENFRKSLLNNNNIVSVNDMGSGSLKMGSRSRRISDIARYSSTRMKYSAILAKFARLSGGKDIIEMGTSLGIGTLAMALSAPSSRVITIEGCPETAAVARENFRLMAASNIDIHVGDIGIVLNELESGDGISPGLVFIDGNHSEEPLLQYFDTIARNALDDTVVIVDDIHLSKSMERGWTRIKEDKRVRVTVDILQMGLVFFRKGLSRENHVIRY